MSRKMVVTALYDYEGQEEKSLSFSQGDVIRVLNQLESGWWDGVCKGNRGWFPSNYVSLPEIATTDLSPPSARSPATPKDLLLSAAHDNHVISSNDNTNSSTNENVYNINTSRISTHSNNNNITTPMSAQSDFSFSKAMRTLTEDLPPNWQQRTSATDGRVYFYNTVTEESTWNISNIDPNTGELVVVNTTTNTTNWTWNTLSDDIVNAIHNLNVSAKNNQKDSFISQSSTVVESIRLLLYASGTARKDSPIVTSNMTLKANHRYIMNSLSKLVLAAKLASGAKPPSDSIPKMQQTCHDVLLAVRGFVGTALEMGLSIQNNQALNNNNNSDNSMARRDSQTAAEFNDELSNNFDGNNDYAPYSAGTNTPTTATTPSSHMLPPPQSNGELVTLLEKYTKLVVKMISSLMKSIRSEQCNSSTLIADVRSMVTEVGNFLAAVDEMPIDTLTDELSVDFKVNRLALYNSISGLVMATQTATSPLAPSNALEQVVLSTGLVEKAVKDLLISTKFLIEEKESIDDGGITGGVAIPGSGDNPYPSEEPVKPRRTVSLSALAPPLLTAIPELPPQQQKELSQHYPARALPPVETGGLELIDSFKSNKEYPKSAGPGPAPYNQLVVDGSSSSSSSSSNTEDMTKRTSLSTGKDKIKKFFGEVPTNGVVSQHSVKEQKPVYLGFDYQTNDILFNMEGRVKGGTLDALVERLTLHESYDANFAQNFLLTYRSFTSSSELFSLLKKRFLITPIVQLNEDEASQWKEKKQTPVQLRVFNTMKTWIEMYYEDYPEDRQVLQEMKEFATDTMSQSISFASQQLVGLAEKREKSGGSTLRKMVQTSRECPPPILPRNLKKMKFLDIDPLEIARQLTLLESKDFNKIQPVEFLKKAWSDKESDISVNVKTVVNMSNLVTSWVAESILLCKDVKIRASYIKHFILIAERCRGLNNFNTLMSILAGLNSAPIHRLKRTFELLSTRSQGILENLRNLMTTTKNFSVYREALRSSNPPAIPFLGCYLTDLTFIEDGNPDFLKTDSRLINFSKRAKTSEVIREVQQYQSVPFMLTPVMELQNFLVQCLAESLDETQMYDLSLQLEPREREDEKIARLLSESGFL